MDAEHRGLLGRSAAVGATLLATMAGYAFAKYDFPGKQAALQRHPRRGDDPAHRARAARPTCCSRRRVSPTPRGRSSSRRSSARSACTSCGSTRRTPSPTRSSRPPASTARASSASSGRSDCACSGPGLVTVFLFSLVATWNNYFLPLIMLNTSDLYPLTVGLAQLQAAASAGRRHAGAVLHGDHRLVRLDPPADHRVPVPAALLAVGLGHRQREGLTHMADATTTGAGTFEIGEEDFLLDGQPHRILSGAIHYFRVHPEQWADRIRKARLMGLNAIETYVAWNAHEPREGEWDATGANDLGRVPRRRRRRGHARDRATRTVHLRGVGQRRTARLAVPATPSSACAAPNPTTSPRSRASSRMSTRSSRRARSTAAAP